MMKSVKFAPVAFTITLMGSAWLLRAQGSALQIHAGYFPNITPSQALVGKAEVVTAMVLIVAIGFITNALFFRIIERSIRRKWGLLPAAPDPSIPCARPACHPGRANLPIDEPASEAPPQSLNISTNVE